MEILLVILNLLLLGLAGFLFYKNRKEVGHSEKMFSDLEDMDLIEFQQNLKALIEELNRVTKTSITDMEEKKADVELIIKAADVRISEIKYLMERNKYKRQAEYKDAMTEPVADKSSVLPFENIIQSKELQDTQKLFITGMEETAELASLPDVQKPVKDKYQHISSLIKNGLSIEEIAKVTGFTKGEIELVRNIKR